MGDRTRVWLRWVLAWTLAAIVATFAPREPIVPMLGAGMLVAPVCTGLLLWLGLRGVVPGAGRVGLAVALAGLTQPVVFATVGAFVMLVVGLVFGLVGLLPTTLVLSGGPFALVSWAVMRPVLRHPRRWLVGAAVAHSLPAVAPMLLFPADPSALPSLDLRVVAVASGAIAGALTGLSFALAVRLPGAPTAASGDEGPAAEVAADAPPGDGRQRRLGRRGVVLRLAAGAGLLVGILLVCRAAARANCDHTTELYPAPAGHLTAVVDRDVCNLGATGWSVNLQVLLRDQPDWLGRADEVRLVGMRRYGSTASVRWADARSLVVEYRPDGSDEYPLYEVGPDEWRGVRVEYRDLRAGLPPPRT